MKRGFLKGKILASTSQPEPAPATPHPASLQQPSKNGDRNVVQEDANAFFALQDCLLGPRGMPKVHTTSVLSEQPRIVQADVRLIKSPCFLYLPHTAAVGEASTVIVDYLDQLREIAKWPLWTKPSVCAPTREPCFRITEVSGKGVGMVATRAIKAGEVIISERPTFAMRLGVVAAKDQTYAEGTRVFGNGAFERNALSGLSDAARNALLALKCSHPPEDGRNLVLGIFMTNSLGLDVKPERAPQASFSAVFLTLSRANHSCTPSAHYYFDVETFEGQFRAVREIAKDEEITIAYTFPDKPCAERQDELLRCYAFTCTCQTCTLSPTLLAHSDACRDGLYKIIYNSRLIASNPERVSLSVFERAMAAAAEEGLIWECAQVAWLGARMAKANYAPKTAAKWLKKAKDAYVLVQGESSWSDDVLGSLPWV